MKQSIIYALDFDGVICDSAIETGVSGWKAGAQLWSDYLTPLPTQELIEKFRQIRPIMGTGYEAILIVRMLHDGETVESIVTNYAEKKQKVLDNSKQNIDTLKKLFGDTRDSWINDDLNEWVEMNPLFSEIAKKLQQLTKQGIWYIVTTKQERFVKQILVANGVEIPDERIFGLDRNMTKEAVLIDLVNRHTQETVCFVEDMLPTLLKILNNSMLESVKLFFALWGYNTAEDKRNAEKQAIKLINLDEFTGQDSI